MTATRRGRRDDEGSGVPGTGGATVRGALLVAVAVLVGVVLLGKGFDTGFLPSTSETPSERADDDDEDDAAGTTTSTTATPVTHAANEVRVIILNSTGPSGSAGTATTVLNGLGYVTLEGANAVDRNVQVTAVYATPGFEADAAAIAGHLSITAAPQPMPTPPPAPAGTDVNVVIVLGADFTPPG